MAGSEMSLDGSKPVLILGAGINGSALARELVLNRVPVVLADLEDIASGTTAYSSRLVHGGLRYLEYAEFNLVRESLREREILLRTAPHLVRPLRLCIPVESRSGAFWQSASRFVLRRGWGRPRPRGLWLVRGGLWLYDRFAKSQQLPRHQIQRVTGDRPPRVNADRYRWLCSYHDAQLEHPERLCIEFLRDARCMAQTSGTRFDILTYHQAERHGPRVELRPTLAGVRASEPTTEIEPCMIVNATGAWVDETLGKLRVEAPRLIGGTRGSHIVTSHSALRHELADGGVYVEASDGRPVFLLPLGGSTLIGTTDIHHDGDPRGVVATPGEIEYLVSAVNMVFPQCGLSMDDVHLSYAGVRPLPYVEAQATAAITRRHVLREHPSSEIPLLSVIGGK
jgi:glycerol-3-phosphate dehydrogenase